MRWRRQSLHKISVRRRTVRLKWQLVSLFFAIWLFEFVVLLQCPIMRGNRRGWMNRIGVCSRWFAAMRLTSWRWLSSRIFRGRSPARSALARRWGILGAPRVACAPVSAKSCPVGLIRPVYWTLSRHSLSDWVGGECSGMTRASSSVSIALHRTSGTILQFAHKCDSCRTSRALWAPIKFRLLESRLMVLFVRLLQ